MYPRSNNDGPWRSEASSGARRSSGPSPMRSERVREIQQRIAVDAYRSADVAEEIARRILRSRDL
jgi:hypothetical protein